MQWLFDIIEEMMEAAGFIKHSYTDRGTYGPNDFENGDFTIDGAWHELDLSAIIPEGTTAVALRCGFHSDVVGWFCKLRKHGTEVNLRTSVGVQQVATIKRSFTTTVGVSEDRKIDYSFSPAANLAIGLLVRGWWK